MREIKFRAWNKDCKKMIYLNDLKTMFFDGEVPNYHNRCKTYELMQYTGLKDINGVEIYEGDIMQHDNDNFIGHVMFGIYKDTTGQDRYEFYIEWVKHDYNKTYRKDLIYWIKKEKIKIIGNIYENKELVYRSENG